MQGMRLPTDVVLSRYPRAAVLQVSEAFEIGGAEFVVKFVLYFAHERLWALTTVL
jgi:hypothetical protein